MGGGHSRLEELMSVLGVPVMSKSRFISTERGIGEEQRQGLVESTADAGKEDVVMQARMLESYGRRTAQ